MLTGDSWAETVSRPGVFTARDGFWVATYYVSFVLLTQLVLINVVVAVLLTGFDDYEEDEGLTLAEKLTALLALLRSRSLEASAKGGACKMIVFVSSCDSVDFL